MTASPIETATFAELGLAEDLVQAVTALGYEEPTPIQSAAIPVLLAGRDLLGLAATGTGKTAAFTLPLLHHLDGSRPGAPPRALVVVPTRELAMQVAQAVHVYGKARGVQVLAVYGGASFGHQAKALQRGVDVIVATPGRALDHLRRGTLRLDCVGQVVLDEADEMLDMGFQEDIEALLAELPEERQAALFSATFPSHLRHVANRVLRQPQRVEVEPEQVEAGEVPRVRQLVYLVQHAHKEEALARVLDMEVPESTLVFCRTRTEVDALSNALAGRGYRAEALHGGLSQLARDRVMDRLRNQAADLVVATDVAARGIDIEHLTHVINFDLPTSPEQYVHRIGRVGRAGREGTAISLAEPRERRLLNAIEYRTGARLELQPVPTVADLRERRLDLVTAQVREAALDGDLEPYHRAVQRLLGELDVSLVAAAALKALAEATGPDDQYEEDIPQIAARPPRPDAQAPGAARADAAAPGAPARRPRESGAGWAKVFVGAGRLAGIRPGDLFGAIVNETGLPKGAIGAIQITDRFALVDVAEDQVDLVVSALRGTKLRGQKVPVHRDRGQR
jgi:ATP-dependent RNA helicase DeaD